MLPKDTLRGLSKKQKNLVRPTPQKSGAAASGGHISAHASAVQNMLENGLTQFMQFRAQAAQAAHASAAAAQAEHLLRNIGEYY